MTIIRYESKFSTSNDITIEILAFRSAIFSQMKFPSMNLKTVTLVIGAIIVVGFYLIHTKDSKTKPLIIHIIYSTYYLLPTYKKGIKVKT